MSTPPLTPLAAAVLALAEPPERALEIECGEGDGVLFLAREFPAARVRGVDGSAQRVRAAAARVGLDPEGRVAFKAGSPSSLPYPDEFFDLVVCIDGRPGAREAARVLRPGAHLILASTDRPLAQPGLRGRLLRRRLARRGFAEVAAADAGDGSFVVLRRGPAEPGAPAE